MRHRVAVPLCSGSQCCCSLRCVACRNAATVKALAQCLGGVTQLTEIEFEDINFDADPTENLAVALLSMQRLQVLRMKEVTFQTTNHAIEAGVALLGKSGLKELSFSHVQIPYNANALQVGLALLLLALC